MIRNKKRRSYERRGALAGFLFILPWFIGFVFFFAKPFAQAVLYSFGEVSFPDGGGIHLQLSGFQNYKDAFIADSKFPRALWESLGGLLADVLIILAFSLFVALILKSKFRGRTAVRAIFFLPVIIASGCSTRFAEQQRYGQPPAIRRPQQHSVRQRPHERLADPHGARAAYRGGSEYF